MVYIHRQGGTGTLDAGSLDGIPPCFVRMCVSLYQRKIEVHKDVRNSKGPGTRQVQE